ncbi:hypothetical protein [Chelativorans alearense]|uniref:hypothetical protein n=1 Tax=Chelativorans alearense TaxID=2681495 RepID=UPI0013D28A38|nr:hypothetical protein [Chelativorans alearense]
MTRRRQSDDLAAKVRFLSDPQAYPIAPKHVEARETHMSWVFLTDERVYKLKKPVKRTFLDFSTVARRKFFCEEELRLNRRLAPETYLQAVPLYRSSSGTFSLASGGRIVDWLVEMRRLPQADMLDERIPDGRVGRGDVERIARLLAGFYACREPERACAGAYLRHLVEEHRLNRSILARSDPALAEMAAGPLDAVERLLARLRPEIFERIAADVVVEGHGDLRPEHVCLSHPPQIIDCLEFNRAMRIIDPYDEVNYLGMESEMLGAPWIRPMLSAALGKRHGYYPSADLLALYGAFRALLRARLCIVHLMEKPVRHPEKWRPLAVRYIEQAEHELSSRSPEDRKSTRRREGV